MLFDSKAKNLLLDELRQAPWRTEEERGAFVERYLAAGDLAFKALIGIVRETVRSRDARHADTILTTFADILSAAGTAEHVGPLAELLVTATPQARRHVTAALGRLPIREQVAPVIDLLRADKQEIREAGRDVLTAKGGPAVYEALLRALGEGTWPSRKEGFEALVGIGGHRAIEALGEVLRRGERRDQALALAHLADRERMAARFELALQAIRAGLATADPELKVRIAVVLGDVGGPEDVPLIVELLRGADRRYQQSLIRALGRLGTADAIPALVPHLRSSYVSLRIETLQALGCFEHEDVIEHLVEALRDDELLVRQKAIELLAALGRSPSIRIGRLLVQMMRDRDVNVRRSVIEVIRAIGNLDQDQAWSKLIQYLKDEDWWVRESVTEVLTQVGGPEILKPIVKLLEDPNEIVRRYAIEVMVKIGDRAVAPHLARATRDPDWWVQERAIEALASLGVREAVPHLVKMLGQESLRWVLVRSLGQLADAQATAALIGLLDWGSPEFRVAVLDALEQIGDRSAIPALGEVAREAEPRVRHRAKQVLQRFDVAVQAVPEDENDRTKLSLLDRLLLGTRDKGASDLFLLAGQPPLVKFRGEVVPVSKQSIPNEQLEKMLLGITNAVQHKRFFEDREDLDFSYSIPGMDGRFRVNLYRQWTGLAATFRVVPNQIMTLEELGLPVTVRKLCSLRTGLVLVTGPTASGKSTTLAAMIDFINKHRNEHVITVEDPIEYVHQNIGCVINQREVGVHTLGFAEALRGALRQDPDVVLVGEMRDQETIATALTAAETGHLVLGTLHTVSAAKTVDRVIDVFPPNHQGQVRTMLSESLRAVISQHLVPRIDHPGMALALEVMTCTEAIANLIRKEKTYQIPSVLATTAEVGNQLMDNELLKLVKAGVISPEEGYAKAENKREFESYLPRPDESRLAGAAAPQRTPADAAPARRAPVAAARASARNR